MKEIKRGVEPPVTRSTVIFIALIEGIRRITNTKPSQEDNKPKESA